MSFSERMGISKPREIIQLKSIDENLRVAIYNYLYRLFENTWYDDNGNRSGIGAIVGQEVWESFFRQPADKFPESFYDFMTFIKSFVLETQWNYVYDLIEFVSEKGSFSIEDGINKILERDMSGYRLLRKKIVPVSDESELSAIEGALKISDRFASARKHIVSALDKLSQKPDPDLRNAIKEAISAVESAARIITGDHKATLGDALKVLEKKGKLHSTLKSAWLKLYGYTSDEHGLRHAMTEDPNIDFSTAKYMVVSCAAFVNLLSAVPG